MLDKLALKLKAADHWEQHLPEMFKEMVEDGTLAQSLDQAVNRTVREVEEQVANGLPEDEALMNVRERYLILNPRKEQEEDLEEPSPGLQLAQEIQQATQEVQRIINNL